MEDPKWLNILTHLIIGAAAGMSRYLHTNNQLDWKLWLSKAVGSAFVGVITGPVAEEYLPPAVGYAAIGIVSWGGAGLIELIYKVIEKKLLKKTAKLFDSIIEDDKEKPD